MDLFSGHDKPSEWGTDKFAELGPLIISICMLSEGEFRVVFAIESQVFPIF